MNKRLASAETGATDESSVSAFHLLPDSGTHGGRSGCTTLASGGCRATGGLVLTCQLRVKLTPTVQVRPVFLCLPWSHVQDN